MVCDDCHCALHEGGWLLTGDADLDLTLIRPDNTEIRLGPPPLRPDIRNRFGIQPPKHNTSPTGHDQTSHDPTLHDRTGHEEQVPRPGEAA